MRDIDLQHLYNLFSAWEKQNSDADSSRMSDFFETTISHLTQILKAKAQILQLPDQEGEDTAQLVLLKLIQTTQDNAFRPKGPRELWSWLLRVGTNHLLSARRRSKRIASIDQLGALSAYAAEIPDGRTPVESLDTHNLLALVSNVLSEDELFVLLRHLRLEDPEIGKDSDRSSYEIIAKELSLIRERKGDLRCNVSARDVDHIIRRATDRLVPLGIRLANGENLHICPEPRSLSGPNRCGVFEAEWYKSAPPRKRICYFGHEVEEFQFDWGLEKKGAWGSAHQRQVWDAPGVYIVRVRCRCSQGVVSSWYGSLKVTVSAS